MSYRRWISCGLFLCCAFALTLPARAASDIFLQVQGIPGESADAKHKQWIEVQSFGTGVTQSGAAASRGGGGGAGKVDIAPFTVVKMVDSATPHLFIHACSGKHIPKAVLEVAAAGEKSQVFLRYTLSDVIVSSIRTSGAGAGEATRPTEEVSFTYGKIELEYTPQDKGGKTGQPVKVGWDASQNKAVSGPTGGTGSETTAVAPAGESDTAAAPAEPPAADGGATASASAPAAASPALRGRVRRAPAGELDRAQPKQR